jgi:exosortase
MLNIKEYQNIVRSCIVIVVALLLGMLFVDTGGSYINKWLKFDESLGHGILVIAIIIYHLFIDAKGYIHKQEPYRNWLLPLIILGIIFQFVSFLWGILIFQQIGLYFLWVLISIYILGVNFNKKIAFPLFLFIFAIPFWDFLNPILLNLTTFVVTSFLKLTALVVFIEENRIETPFGIIEIANGCSGLKFFEIGLVLSVYAVHLEKMTIKSKAVIIIAGASLAIITNWVRVTLLIFIGYNSKMESSLMEDHETFGFILFFIVISGIFFLIKRLRLPIVENENLSIKPDKTTFLLKGIFIRSSLVIGCCSLTFPLNNIMNSLATDSITVNQHMLLNNKGAYIQTSSDIKIQGKLCLNTQRQYLFNKPGKDVIPYKAIYNKDSFTQTAQTFFSLTINEQPIEVIKLSLISKGERKKHQLYYWYEYNNIAITNYYIAKLLEITYLFKSEEKLELHAILCKN